MSHKPSRLLIIYCGGTIGMLDSALGLRVDENFAQTLSAQLAQYAVTDVDIISINPLIDSATATPQDWLNIIQTIDRYQDEYDGFIILHGTDTLAYTAAALSLWGEALGKAIIITGAQRPMAYADSDGLDNILGAIDYARLANFNQVGVFFGGLLLNPRAVRKVHAQADQAFMTPNTSIWGERTAQSVQLYQRQIKSYPSIISPTKIGQLHAREMLKQSAVALLHLTPAMSDSLIKAAFAKEISAVVLLTYGVGNMPANSTLKQCLADATAEQKLLINCSQCFWGHTAQTTYAAGVTNAGVLEGGSISYEFAYVLSYFAVTFDLSRAMVLNHIDMINQDDS